MRRVLRRRPPGRVLLRLSVAAIALLAGVAVIVFWLNQRHPAQDLRVSFHIPIAAPGNPAVTYTFQNLGRDAVALQAVGLLVIADNPTIINDSDNVDLCDRLDPATLKPPDGITAEGADLSEAGQRRTEYAPVTATVAGKPWSAGAMLHIAAGQSLAVATGFNTAAEQTAKYSNEVFCPVVWLASAGHGSAAAVCQGFAMATNNGGVSNTIVARQFRVLPASSGASCPIAGR